jgi:protein SCO1/2
VSRQAIAAILAGAGLGAAGCGGGRHAAPATTTHAHGAQSTTVRTDPSPAFSLRDQDGRRVSLAAQRDSVVLVTFLYTRCPDVCPLLATNLNTALRLLAARERSQVRVLAISVDPEHDTPRAVRRFIADHHLVPQFRYLTGTRASLRPIWQGYNVLAIPATEERVDHSAYVVLVDRRGMIRTYLAATTGATTVARRVREALAG